MSTAGIELFVMFGAYYIENRNLDLNVLMPHYVDPMSAFVHTI